MVCDFVVPFDETVDCESENGVQHGSTHGFQGCK